MTLLGFGLGMIAMYQLHLHSWIAALACVSAVVCFVIELRFQLK